MATPINELRLPSWMEGRGPSQNDRNGTASGMTARQDGGHHPLFPCAADEMLGRALAGLPRDSYCLVGAVGHDFYKGERAGSGTVSGDSSSGSGTGKG